MLHELCCHSTMARLALLAALAAGAAATRTRFLLDDGFKFQLQGQNPAPCPNPDAQFPINLNGQQCLGLQQAAEITSQEDCETNCCGQPECGVWQWCPAGTTCGGGGSGATCWIGPYSAGSCQAGAGWVSRARNVAPGPGPSNTTCTEAWCNPSTPDGPASGWSAVTLPHDFVVLGNFSQSASKSQGYLPFGVGYYRRHFAIPQALRSAGTFYIDVEAAQTASVVFLNGKYLGSHASGYTPARYWLTASQLNMAGDNVLAISVDATKPDSWWYDGGGLYRHVWLTAVTTPGPFLIQEGIYAPSAVTGPITWPAGPSGTPVADAQLMPSIEVAANGTGPAQPFTIALTVTNKATGAVVATASGSGSVIPGAPNATVWTPSAPLPLPAASLWHLVAPPARPALYVLTVTLSVGGTPVDSLNATFGVRTIRWDAAQGFFLNGVQTKILGTANHQDAPAVGVAVPDHLQYHRVAALQALGINGWRTAHNPPNPALLDATDELGMLVWDENHRLAGHAPEIELLVRRDRNHPSVVIWSLCNEVLCQTSDDWVQEALAGKALFHALDPLGGRPVSANQNGWVGPSTPLDVQGFDYNTQSYDKWHAEAPGIPSISSETSSAVSDRGEYVNDPASGHVSGYDNNYPGWGESAEQAWGGVGEANGQGILTRPFISGGWTWTGWDYRGEPTPYAWPDTNSHFGILDLCGFPKDRAFWYAAWFKPSQPLVHILPATWNWPSNTSTVHIWAFSNGAAVELFLNGASQGKQTMPQYGHVEWISVPYKPGSLRAVAYDANGAVIAEDWQNTTSAPAALALSFKDGVGASGLVAGCADAALVQVAVLDADGLVVDAAVDVTFSLSSGLDLTLAGTCNGDPATLTNNASPLRTTYHGLALAVVKGGAATGSAVITATAPGLPPATLTITQAAPPAGWSASWCHAEPTL